MKKVLGILSALAGLAILGGIAYYVYKHYFCSCCCDCACDCEGDEACDCDGDECEVKKNTRHSRGYFHLGRVNKDAE